MSQQLNELEERIGYHFHNRDYLRRALTCQSAINEGHPDAADQNFQALEFIGDAALKHAVATLLYLEQDGLSSAGGLHDKVLPFISNSTLSRIGRELNLSQFIIKGKGVSHPTDKMLADTIEAILGAIVIDQQQQGNNSEDTLIDVVVRLWSIKRKNKLMAMPPVQSEDKKCCCCCKCSYCMYIGIIFAILFAMAIAYFSFPKK